MENNKKRVYCLYRESTLKQVEKDDVPMPVQQKSCREFAEKMGWEIVDEKEESGVSGFKKTAKQRDKLQEIQYAAVLGKFDVLLVFMFDRLGRRDEETPHIVEWFVQQGIEVWSVKEGQRRFDQHVDKLINYIHFWQASGESIKTSIRTKEALGQLVEKGRFRGGIPPFGYLLAPSGIINKRNHEVFALKINPDEAPVVSLIFDLYIKEGFGTLRICNYLREVGIKTREGKCFTNPTIQHMLKNLTYTGVLRNGECHSDVLLELQIIDEASFKRAQELLTERTNKCKDSTVPRSTKGQSLFSRNIYCGHCGARLVLTTNGKRYVTDETGAVIVVPKLRYICYNKTRHHNCDGQTGYTVAKLDDIVEQIVLRLFERLQDAPPDKLISDEIRKNQDTTRAVLASAEKAFTKHQKEYETYKAEVIKSIQGQSKFNADILNELLETSKTVMDKAEAEMVHHQKALADSGQAYKEAQQNLKELLTWADLYQSSSMASKRMIMSQLVKAVRVRRDYELEIDFNIAYEQYCMGF
jgi:DNA invertase Pin-like site-specific DNA recombinase